MSCNAIFSFFVSIAPTMTFWHFSWTLLTQKSRAGRTSAGLCAEWGEKRRVEVGAGSERKCTV